MSEIILSFVVILLSGLGMVYIIAKLFDAISWGRDLDNRLTMIIPLYLGTEDVEYVLKKAILVREQSEGDFPIIAVDFAADEETKRICKIIADNNENVEFMTPEELDLYFVELKRK